MAGKQAKQDVLTEDEDDQVATQPAEIEIEDEQQAAPADEHAEVVEDERTAVNADESEESEAAPQPAAQERQKETAKERRERAKAAKERDKRELRFQANEIRRLDDELRKLKTSQSETHVTVLDERLAAALNEVQQFQTIEINAAKAQDFDASVQARQLREAAKERAAALAAEKQKLQQPVQAPQGPSEAQLAYARTFMERHPWYDPASGDEDSAIVMALDNQVARSGFRPDTPDYWRELEARVARRLPKKSPAAIVEDDIDDVEDEPAPKPKGGPPVGGRSQVSASGRAVIKLSPARVQAIKDAGLWDNPKDRERMAKKYAEYDREQRANR